jgi:hypothetical protein
MGKGFLCGHPNPFWSFQTAFQGTIQNLEPIEEKFNPIRCESPVIPRSLVDFEMHHRREDQQSVRPKHPTDFINRFLRMRKMLKGFEVQYQSDALIRNGLHIPNITDNINAGWIKVSHILFDIPLPRKEGLVKIGFPSRTGIKDGFLERETFNGPFYIVDDRFSQSDLLFPIISP